jgi:hypothetical protein
MRLRLLLATFTALATTPWIAASSHARDCLSDLDSPEAKLARESGVKAWNDNGGGNTLVVVRISGAGESKTKLIPLPESGTRVELSRALLEETSKQGTTYVIHPSQEGVAYILPYSEDEVPESFNPTKDCPRALRESRAIRGECSIIDLKALEKATLVYGIAGEKCDALARIRTEDFEDAAYRRSLAEAKELLNELFNLKAVGENRSPSIDRQATRVAPGPKLQEIGSSSDESKTNSDKPKTKKTSRSGQGN